MNKREIGSEYEDLAAGLLAGKGYRIVRKNYRTPYGEIDILAEKDGVWVFCEVKFRRSDSCGTPLESVDARKQRRISKSALYYYSRHGFTQETPCRFDVIAVYGDGRVEHVENAFEFQM